MFGRALGLWSFLHLFLACEGASGSLYLNLLFKNALRRTSKVWTPPLVFALRAKTQQRDTHR